MATLLLGGDKVLMNTPVVGDVYKNTPVVKDVVADLQVLEFPKEAREARHATDMFVLVGLGIIGALYIYKT